MTTDDHRRYMAFHAWASRRGRRWARAKRYAMISTDPARNAAYRFFVCGL